MFGIFSKRKCISESLILPEDYFTFHNGIKIKWFIGDGIYDSVTLKPTPNIFHAWGSCNKHAYQMGANFNKKTRELYNIQVLSDRNNPYFHEPTYDLLTKKV